MKKILLPLFSAGLIALVTALPAQAFNPQPDPPGRWAMLGLISEQTMRVSVLAVPVATTGVLSCKVSLNFVDSEGNKLVEGSTLMLVPGKAKSIDLRGAALRLAVGERMQMRADVQVLHNPPAYLPCPGVTASVELIEPSGRTSLIVLQPMQFAPD